MENVKELLIATIVVIALCLILDLASLPSSYGKLFAYFGVGFLPVLIIQFQKNNKLENSVSTAEFVFALILNTFMVLFFSIIVLVLIFNQV